MFKILLILVLCSGSLSFGAGPKNCGSSYVGSAKRAEGFLNQLRLSVKDSALFSNLFKLPIKVKFESGKTKKITSKDYLVKNHSQFMKSGLKALFSGEKLSDYFCNYQGLDIIEKTISLTCPKDTWCKKKYLSQAGLESKELKVSHDFVVEANQRQMVNKQLIRNL